MGDAVSGKKLFMQLCSSCHTTESGGKHRVGPNLHGIYGKTCGSFLYTTAMMQLGIKWDEKALDDYLRMPQRFLRGTKMHLTTPDPARRRDIIEYLKTLK